MMTKIVIFSRRENKENTYESLAVYLYGKKSVVLNQKTKGMTNLPANIENYGGHYSDSSLWDKIKKLLGKAGKEVVYNALTLYYALQNPKLPTKDKAIIIGALGYLILPADLVPDFLPLVGYTDDAAALYAAIKKVWGSITPEVKLKARAKTDSLLGAGEVTDIIPK